MTGGAPDDGAACVVVVLVVAVAAAAEKEEGFCTIRKIAARVSGILIFPNVCLVLVVIGAMTTFGGLGTFSSFSKGLQSMILHDAVGSGVGRWY